MAEHQLELRPGSPEDEVMESSPGPDAADTGTCSGESGIDGGSFASEHAKSEAVNAMAVHEGKRLLAYSHVGCRDHAIMLGALPGPVQVKR